MPAEQKIKVLECIRQGQIGGGESHLLSLMENIDRTKFDPVVLSFTDGPMIKRLQEMQIDTHIIHTTKPFDLGKWGQVKNLIRKQQAQLVHAHGTRANSNVNWAARSLGLPVVYTVHGWSFHQDQKPLVKKIRVWGEKYLTARSAVNISVSASNQQSGKTLMPSFRSEVINNGIDMRRFDATQSFPDIRRELHIAADEVLVLFIARFTLQKQPLQLIEAFRKALEQNPQMHLLMVGEGDLKPAAEALIAQHNLGSKITLSPFRQDVPAVLAAADIFVLPSLWEGLPIGLLEAMAMGKAVIASEVDGTLEIIRQEENGLLVNTGSLVDDTASALVKLSQNRALAAKLGKAAKETVKDRFNAADMTRKIEKIYEDLIHPKPVNQQP